jgi:uncharacterized membrane-anchored protein YjiN (DUF445 family)
MHHEPDAEKETQHELAQSVSASALKAAALARKRALATGLLLVAVLLFIAMQFLPPFFFVRLTTAAAEAAIVGGLADWFAVTALFRHPLGIPIPHTALIPSQKNDIGRALGNFVRDRFLSPALVVQRLRAENRALQLAHWLMSERASAFITGRVLEAVPLLLKGSNDQHLREFLARIMQEGMRRVDIVPLADAGLAALIESGKHMELVDQAAALLQPSIGALKDIIIDKVGARTGRLFPKYFDRKIGKGIVKGLQAWLDSVRNPPSEERQRLDLWIRERVAEFRASPDYGGLLEKARLAVVANPALHRALEGVWEEMKREITADLTSQAPQIGVAVGRMVRTAGMLLQETPSMQDHFNAALEHLVVDYIAPWRNQISDFISEVVESWDAKTVSELIELEVGSDLQYVRINGTVVGALIGIILFLASTAIARVL